MIAGEGTDYFTGATYRDVIGARLESPTSAGGRLERGGAWVESIPPESTYPGVCWINHAAIAFVLLRVHREDRVVSPERLGVQRARLAVRSAT